MTVESWLKEQETVNEPKKPEEYDDFITEQVKKGCPVIIRRKGKEPFALIPVNLLDEVREMLVELDKLRETWADVERQAAQIDRDRVTKMPRPPQSWIDDTTDDPFTPEDGAK